MNYDYEVEKMYHPENFEDEGYASQKDYEESEGQEDE
jgi:hypothetical protein